MCRYCLLEQFFYFHLKNVHGCFFTPDISKSAAGWIVNIKKKFFFNTAVNAVGQKAGNQLFREGCGDLFLGTPVQKRHELTCIGGQQTLEHLSYKERLRQLELFSMKKEGSGEIWIMCLNTWWGQVMRKMEPDSSQCSPMTEETISTN